MEKPKAVKQEKIEDGTFIEEEWYPAKEMDAWLKQFYDKSVFGKPLLNLEKFQKLTKENNDAELRQKIQKAVDKFNEYLKMAEKDKNIDWQVECKQYLSLLNNLLSEEKKKSYYECGHNGNPIIGNDSPLLVSAWLEWKDTVGFDGDKSQCWECWCKKEKRAYKTHKVKACANSIFHGIDCLESEDRFGFFKSEADIRPSSCTWVDKGKAEKMYELFTTTTTAKTTTKEEQEAEKK